MFIGGFVHQMTLLLRGMQIYLPEGNSLLKLIEIFKVYDVSILNSINL